MLTEDDNARRIAELNDQCRRALGGRPGCRGLQTSAISSLPPDDQCLIRQQVLAFDDFTEDNDPHGEHDFGAFDFKGQRIFWKIDCYALDMESGSEDPADPSQTVRVLTIMLAEEY